MTTTMKRASVRFRSQDACAPSLWRGREVESKQTRSFGCSVKWAGKQETIKKFMDKLAAEPVTIELVDVEALKELTQERFGETAARQLLGDVVRSVRDRDAGTRDD
ncbi:MAG: hypothetical protein M3R15_11240 [Acidobacteriota bacterium]|nr:hypothetical protein [Acidobacteriota bacterium]